MVSLILNHDFRETYPLICEEYICRGVRDPRVMKQAGLLSFCDDIERRRQGLCEAVLLWQQREVARMALVGTFLLLVCVRGFPTEQLREGPRFPRRRGRRAVLGFGR